MNAFDTIAGSLANIEKSLASIASSSGGIDSLVIPALAGAFAAFLFNHWHWRIVDARQAKSKLSTALYDCIKELEESSIKYWLTASDNNSEIENKQVEISIKSQFTIMRTYINEFNKADNGTETSSTLNEFSDDIFDLVTGGGFESKNRPESPGTASKISNKCTRTRAFLSRL